MTTFLVWVACSRIGKNPDPGDLPPEGLCTHGTTSRPQSDTINVKSQNFHWGSVNHFLRPLPI